MHRIAQYLTLNGLVALGLLVTGLVIPPSSLGQTPTPAQMEAFQSLPADQQQQILEQIGERRGTGQPAAAPSAALPTSQPRMDEATERLIESLEETPRLRAGDTLLLTVDLLVDPEKPEKENQNQSLAREQHQRRLLDGNPYALDRMGRLTLHGATPIVLAGLSAEEATRRLNADPQLQGYKFAVQLLPVKPELRPFGYDLFSSVPTTFAPATDIPVPSEYVVGPGDVLSVQLIGERGGSHSLTVSRDGTVDFPQLGPIAVAGLRFPAVKGMLEQRVSEQMIGLRANVSMGPLRSIQVFVLGEAERPGSYTVS
jgi:polysaccharide export outer membrane protein